MGCFRGIFELIRSKINQPPLPIKSFAGWSILLVELPPKLALETAKHLACLEADRIIIASKDSSGAVQVAIETKRKTIEYNTWLVSQLLETRGVCENERGGWTLKSAVEVLEWKNEAEQLDGIKLVRYLRHTHPEACMGMGCIVVTTQDEWLEAEIVRSVDSSMRHHAQVHGAAVESPPAYEDAKHIRNDSATQEDAAERPVAAGYDEVVEESHSPISPVAISKTQKNIQRKCAIDCQWGGARTSQHEFSKSRLLDVGSGKAISVDARASMNASEKTSRMLLNALAKCLRSQNVVARV